MPTAVKQSKNRSDDDLPPLPKPDKNGHFPAVEYMPASVWPGTLFATEARPR
jgi:hypothetical protein